MNPENLLTLLPLFLLTFVFGYGVAQMQRARSAPPSTSTKRLSIRVCEKDACWAGKEVHLHGECTTCGGQWTTRMVDPESERKTPVPGASVAPGPERKSV